MVEVRASNSELCGGGGLDVVKSGADIFCSSREVWSGEGVVVGNERIAELTFKLSVEVDEKFPAVRSGQFIMIRLLENIDLLLGRPLAIYRVNRVCNVIELIYLVAGRVTSRFSELVIGSRLRIWGPLGIGFDVAFCGHTILVAGGVGHTPFLMLAEELSRVESSRVTLLYGARSANRVVPLDDFTRLGVEVYISTDDGTLGFRGFVTELIGQYYERCELTRILCCGSGVMLRASFSVASELSLPCVVSLETPMSCGIGLCYGCVVKVKDDNDSNGWTYKRTCVEGPSFDAYKLIF
ncbi:MAG: dihydroorotate dehydrogenase electron transfer subunit [Planctomycetaceae bacterium]|jgi:dihydroorotate dehydrogenase electron transfer subunit|nr:dihydroorotate dehydrogenase electron transfer subunit [Planctomycetaceae bacterium]